MSQLPALQPESVAPHIGSLYPESYRSRVLPREVRRLGEALGLTRIGISLATLEPGKESSMRHWHTLEDEFVYVLEGEVLLRTGAGEQPLTAGMCAGFPAGSRDGHQLVNRGARTARYLVVSNRDPQDLAHYSDADVDLMWDAPGARGRMARRDGTPY
ncbi:MAG TPA: cupin domain-containing protein [Steroidobacteraceae bacterium]|jgi:uncharacterized cupin superfamily protein|nr:cupin domain-containing protein [Steroidobacteraceae bacterium]